MLQLAGFDRQEKINTGNHTTGERQGPGWGPEQGSGKTTKISCNTNTNFRQEKRTVHSSRKKGFHIMYKKNEGTCIIFLKKGEPI